jgi:hypothetical protein
MLIAYWFKIILGNLYYANYMHWALGLQITRYIGVLGKPFTSVTRI